MKGIMELVEMPDWWYDEEPHWTDEQINEIKELQHKRYNLYTTSNLHERVVIPTNDVVKIADGLQAEYREALNNRIANPTDDKENDIAVKNTYAGIIAGITLLLNRLSA